MNAVVLYEKSLEGQGWCSIDNEIWRERAKHGEVRMLVDLFAVEAALTASTREATPPAGWQPIENAPKGDVLLLCRRGSDGDWSMHTGYWSDAGRKGWTTGAMWLDQMTHWMPMPLPPSTKEEPPYVMKPSEEAAMFRALSRRAVPDETLDNGKPAVETSACPHPADQIQSGIAAPGVRATVLHGMRRAGEAAGDDC